MELKALVVGSDGPSIRWRVGSCTMVVVAMEHQCDKYGTQFTAGRDKCCSAVQCSAGVRKGSRDTRASQEA